MKFHINEQQNNHKRYLFDPKGFKVAMLLSLSLLLTVTGCGDSAKEVDEALSKDPAISVTKELDQEDTEPTLVDETEDTTKEEVKLVTEVIYDFENYEEVQPAPAEAYAFDEPIKGIYVSAYAAGDTKWMDNLITLADETELNAFVIDVKNDSGHISFKMDIPMVNEIGADRSIINDIEGLMDKLYEHNIFPIARIVTFKDPYLAVNKPEYAIKNMDGSLWTYSKMNWLNPYNKESWDYVIDVAKEAVRVGFKEIQFDYIRFEASSELNYVDFGGLDTVSREEIILEFVDYALQELKPLGVEVTADVFGIVINSERDAKVIGQDYVEMSKRLDAICPMVYPSHYGYGFFGIPKGQHSDLYPYETIYGSMEDSNEELAVIPEGDHVAEVRPWLQAFTASYLGSGNYMTYGKEAIRDQIQAAYDAGLTEWLLWHAGVRYNQSALLPAETE